MKQQYFIVVLAHSLHGRLRRIHIPQQVIYLILCFAVVGVFTIFGFLSSYLRMVWKVANYNSLRQEVASLRGRYQELQKEAVQTRQDMATFQLLASEVSLAYGIKQKLEGPVEISSEGRLVPSLSESFEEYNFLNSATFSRFRRSTPYPALRHARPNLWPVNGRLLSYFGRRDDPFTFGQAFHAGVDISAPTGTPVKVAADGVVRVAEWGGGYGRVVVVDHGGGTQTLYAHLSKVYVIAGQEVRRGEVIATAGATGRATSSHLHYEVRLGGSPVNPYPFLRSALGSDTRKDLPF